MPSGCLGETVAKGPLALGSWHSRHCCNGCGMHSLLGVQLLVEEKKADRTEQGIRTEGRSSTKEAESKMFTFLHDMDLGIEKLVCHEE